MSVQAEPYAPIESQSEEEKLKLINKTHPSRRSTIRYKLYKLLFGNSLPSRILDYFISALVLGNVVLFILSTVPELYSKYELAMDIFELVSIIIFTIEYPCRVWVCVDSKKYSKYGPYLGRFYYLIDFYSIVDLVAFVSYWIQLAVFGWYSKDSISFISAIRIFRLLRLFKADKYTHGLHILYLVLKNNKETLIMAGMLGGILFLITATALHYSMGQQNPKDYGTIPKCMFMAILMLTGMNYPVDLTPAGTWVVGVTAIFSLAVFAIPTGIIGYGFEQLSNKYVQHRKEVEELKKRRRFSGQNTDTSDSIGTTTTTSLIR
eukprot:TRINITY_DN1964_c0_g1_i1.p1 TRINITY_DN1964_c0_g1~~TRINITY_DN1964_c0_g1_i1.p1  ORF type:complete len:320 (-),score=41.64 TRINITY_DN1964_c0_g1_i1:323-1282(-)